MDIINRLQALRQEFCEIINKDPQNNKRGQVLDRAITAIDNLILALEDIEKQAKN